MKILLLLILAAFLSACTQTAPQVKTMKAFASETELKRYFQQLAEKRKALKDAGAGTLDSYLSADSAPGLVSVPEPEESVTNTQEKGVDEGGIVKVHGDHLVILRRGRLFTVAIGDEQLDPVSAVDAFAPGIDPVNTWYDEMLIAGDTIAVIGYSYERGGTEVGLFNVDAAGKITYQSTYHLRSDDYYSSRNYASRMIGNKLIFYSPMRLGDLDYPTRPAVRKWHEGAQAHEFKIIAQATDIYRPEGEFVVNYGISLHTVTTCDLTGGSFDCKATAVIGPSGHVFYVSPDSVYIWATTWDVQPNQSQSLLFRMPLDGSGPTALRVSGGPVDQFSFLQSQDQHLNVVVRAESKGDGMWAAEVAHGDIALLRIPLAKFTDGSETAPAELYRSLPKPEGYLFQNRFVGNYLIYGTGSDWGPDEITKERKELFLVEWATGGSHRFDLPHSVDRIEQMDTGAVVIGAGGNNLYFTSVRLAPQPEIVSAYTRKEASQGETRSHGFFYRPNGDGSGTLGLPIRTPLKSRYESLFNGSASIVFLRNAGMNLTEAGELGAQADKVIDDRCRASCVDWYGNARPLFLRGRVFALLGYELVEGQVDNDQINELRRVNYAPL
jgi:hypothetical protein